MASKQPGMPHKFTPTRLWIERWRLRGWLEEETTKTLLRDLDRWSEHSQNRASRKQQIRGRLVKSTAPRNPPPPGAAQTPAPIFAGGPKKTYTPSTASLVIDSMEGVDHAGFFGLLERIARFRMPPFMAEAALWFVGVLLTLIGSLYFTQIHWEAWTQGTQSMVIGCGLVAYELVFLGLAHLLRHRGAPTKVPRVLAGLGLGLLPVIALALVNMHAHSHWVYSLLLASAALWAAASCHRLFDGSIRSPVLLGGALLFLSITYGTTEATKLLFSFASLGTLALSCMRSAQTKSTETNRTFVLSYFGYIALSIVLTFLSIPSLAHLCWFAPSVALLTLTIHQIARHRDTRTAIVRVVVILLSCLSLGFALTGPLSQVHGGSIVLVTSVLAGYTLIARGLLDDRSLPLVLGVLCGLLSYFFITSPFDGLILILKSWMTQFFGYTSAPLPIAFYALTFGPYLLAVWLFRKKLQNTGRKALATRLGGTLFALCAGLIGLSFTELKDARPVLLSIPLYFAAIAYEGRNHKNTWALHANAVLLGLWCGRLGALLNPAFGLAAGMAATGLIVSLWSAVSTRARRVMTFTTYVTMYAVLAILALGLTVIQQGPGIFNLAGMPWRLWLGGGLTMASLSFAIVGVQEKQKSWALLGILGLLSVPLFALYRFQSAIDYLGLCAVLLSCISLWQRTRRDVVFESLAIIAPIFASVILVLPMIVGSGCSSFRLLGMLLPLLIAPWTTRQAWWSLMSAIAVAAYSASILDDLGQPPALGFMAASWLVAITTRLHEKKGIQTPFDRHMGRALRLSSVIIAIATAVFLPAAVGPRISFWLITITAMAAFCASGVQVLFAGALLALGISVGVEGAEWGRRLPSFNPAWLVLIVTGLWASASAVLQANQDRSWSSFFRLGPRAFSAHLLTSLGLVSLVGYVFHLYTQSKLPTESALLAVCATAIAFAHAKLCSKLWPKMLLSLWLPLGASMVCGAFFGPNYHALGVVIGGLIGVRLDLLEQTALRISGWGTLGLGLWMTGLNTHGFGTASVMGILSVALALRTYTRPSARSAHLMIGSIASTSMWAWFAIGHIYSTGHSPWLIAPYVGWGFIGLGLALHIATKHAHPKLPFVANMTEDAIVRPFKTWRSILLVAALLSLIVGFPALTGASGLHHGVFFFGVLAHIAWWVHLARENQQIGYALLFEVALGLLWVYLRTNLPFLAAIPDHDAYALILGAFLFAGVHRIARRGSKTAVFESASRFSALLFPLLGIILSLGSPGFRAPIVAVLAAMAYVVVGQSGVSRWSSLLATLALNTAIILSSLEAGLFEPQLYAIPIGASVLLLARLYRGDLSDGHQVILRILALAIIYGTSLLPVLSFSSPGHALVLACICVLGIALGVATKTKSYIFFGLAFLLADLATSIIRFGISSQSAATLVLTALGLSVLASMVTWSLNRCFIEGLYRRLRGEIILWPL